MTDAELIARLRHKTQHRSSDDTCAAYFKRWEKLDNPDGLEAADRIEALIAERDAAEAKLAKAVEFLAEAVHDLQVEGRDDTNERGRECLAFLAEIKGEQDGV